MSEKMTRGGPVECSFKNKGTAKVQTPSSSTNSVGAKICLHRRSWSRGSHGRRRDLQRKSKPELGVLRQDPSTLKSVLCLNKNGVLERKFLQSFGIEDRAYRIMYLGSLFIGRGSNGLIANVCNRLVVGRVGPGGISCGE